MKFLLLTAVFGLLSVWAVLSEQQVRRVPLAHRREKPVLLVRQVFRDPLDLRVFREKLVPPDRQVHKVSSVLRVRLV
jgi:hypothetical protein